MAIGVVFDATGVTQEQYRQVLEQVFPSDQPTPGLRFHAAGMGDDGLVVFEIWESQEDLDRFFNERLGAALQGAGITVQPRIVEIINTMSA